MSLFVKRMQPFDTVWPINHGSFVSVWPDHSVVLHRRSLREMKPLALDFGLRTIRLCRATGFRHTTGFNGTRTPTIMPIPSAVHSSLARHPQP